MTQRNERGLPPVPVSPFADPSESQSPPTRARARSSPLNPSADSPRAAQRSTGYTIGSTTPQLSSARTSGDPTAHSSGSGSSESSDLLEIQAGHIGGGYGPYPTFSSPPSSTTPLRRPSLPFASPTNRFSTVSSTNSVLGFTSDSKYAMPYVSYNPLSRAGIDSVAAPDVMYNLYDREDGPVDDDDYIHEPTAPNEKMDDTSWRGVCNVFVLVFVVVGFVTLFAGYPLIYHFTRHREAWQAAITNGTGQVPSLPNLPSLIDPQTPPEALTRTGFDGEEYELVFSDEFNTDGRSFYPGDDPFWEAVDLWYYSTEDLEWYDPGQVTTRDGALVIVMEEIEEHEGLPYISGMLQSWNKFCFTTGYIEVSVIFPSQSDISGYWPGAWVMGNLGRPGYGATADGLWPYSYDTCDWGTLPNQTYMGQPAAAATAGGNSKYNNNISWLPGQRLSACTCPGEDHPGPSTSVGRGAPEIDIFEAQINKDTYAGGRVTQSVQMAPFSTGYYFPNTSADVTINNPAQTHLNPYRGSALQQAVSALTDTNDTNYADVPGGASWNTYGFEYWSNPSNRDEGFINWVAGSPVFRIDNNVFQGDASLNISNRLISEEPMSIILNLAISTTFQKIDWPALTFPAEFKVDYVRVFQRKGLSDDYRSCDPAAHPTADYINKHPDVYSNPQYKTWASAGGTFPQNSILQPCSTT